jgi:uncharacterized damage-inducible protein DinB
MTYYGAREMAASFRTVRKNTVTIAQEIGEEHYGFKATPECRTVAQTLTHLAFGTAWAKQGHGVERLTTLEGYDFMAFFSKLMAEEQTPRSKQEIAAILIEEGENFAKWLESLSDETLGEAVTMPAGMTPPSKSRFEMILSVKEHEMHHRAQLMVLERMLGLVPHLTREMNARLAEMQGKKAAAS